MIQLHPRLSGDPRECDLQAVDARSRDRALIPEPVDLIVCDASFIGLAKVLPAALALGAQRADLVALVKPQFEVGPAAVGKGGLVRREADRRQALDAVCAFLEAEGWRVRATADSPIRGGEGAQEYLLWASRL